MVRGLMVQRGQSHSTKMRELESRESWKCRLSVAGSEGKNNRDIMLAGHNGGQSEMATWLPAGQHGRQRGWSRKHRSSPKVCPSTS